MGRVDASEMNVYAEPGEFQNLGPREEYAMSPARVEQYLLLVQFALDCASVECYAHDLPEEVVRRAARILKQAPVELPYLPPALPVSQFREAVAEERE